MTAPIPVRFDGGRAGRWRVTRFESVRGVALPPVDRIAVDPVEPDAAALWSLRGVAGHSRYVTRPEREALKAVQAGLGRPEATCAALIPIRKSAAWWELEQDERRAIFEEQSHHTAASLRYLPAIARRLYHARDLGEPFDFLTWFEYAPEHAADFESLVTLLRATDEWRWVEREVDIRLVREA